MSSLAKIALVVAASAGATAASPKPAAQTAVLAGGCFWGMEAVFEHVKGVEDVISGYAGGSAADARYERVSGEGTGHAEAVRIVFDPARISYANLLKIYFIVAHDPTQMNRQGPDSGPSYRSAIFPQDAGQRALATRAIAELDKAHAFRRPVATKVESGRFYPAEAYHQDYVEKHPDAGYVVVNDLPKLAHLKRAFPRWWRG
ncbi:MAG TPA: peptide-methionine (S)-S-oxide reductase MsrA [Sphingomicrobium sp.]|nr:peptide-methionine (S)-S-oxide reductase MsrA [Sphingomicrobium sp.]